VARARRELLLRVHRRALRREDLEDCYSQAVLELLAQTHRGSGFASRLHMANTLEQRFVSRIRDRRRALEGRSPMQAALESALALDDCDAAHPVVEVADVRAELEQLVILREELLRVVVLAAQLTEDQRLVLAGQLGQIERGDFCSHFRWSGEKYRKVAQRARARLRALMASEEGLQAGPAHAAAVGSSSQGQPVMFTPPTHRRVPAGDPGGRGIGGPLGEDRPRVSGRSLVSPSRAPVARAGLGRGRQA
jgi:DNA-directed RNA polymerase specialized sigma24 family protein